MSKKLIGAQRPFTMLVLIPMGGNPSLGINPTHKRRTMTMQHFPEIPGRGPDTVVADPAAPGVKTRQGLLGYPSPPVPAAGTGTITVVNNTFAGPAHILLGRHILKTGEDFIVGGSAAATATALSAAIDALPDYSGSSVGSVVTVTGPVGLEGGLGVFDSRGASANLSFSPEGGVLGSSEPTLGPVEIT